MVLALLLFALPKANAQAKGQQSSKTTKVPPEPGPKTQGTDNNDDDDQDDNITTTVITIDLSKPHIGSVNHSGNKKRLVVKNKDLLAFNLVNGNPFRYRYELNFNKINLFSNVAFDPKPEDVFQQDGESEGTDPEIKMDDDGDAVKDGDDKCPDEAGPKINEGCPMSDEEIKDFVMNELGKAETFLINLNRAIEIYRERIKSAEILDMEEYNIRIQDFQFQYKAAVDLKALNQELFSDLDLSDSDIVTKQNKIDELLESTRVAIESILLKDSKSYTLPIDVNGDNIDYVEVKLEIFDTENQKTTVYTYKVWLEGGVKIDISGGLMITSLFDNQFFTTDAENGEKFINSSDNGGYEFGFGSMVNISMRGTSWVRPALNVGAIFTSNQKFQLLTGIGFIVGKNERFIFHTGVAMGRASDLRDDLVADGETSFDLGTNGNIPLVEKFQFGHYFGLSYNFTKVKAKLPEDK